MRDRIRPTRLAEGRSGVGNSHPRSPHRTTPADDAKKITEFITQAAMWDLATGKGS